MCTILKNKSNVVMKNNQSIWSEKAKLLVKDLHNEISIDNYNWHKFRGNKEKRSAELIISALSQLINNGDEKEIENLLSQAILWIKEDIKDTGCKSH
tara:strand:+ start:1863 stop:2153 length:291 start_codon:yes stop_codon:yes gene_type:complete